MLKLLLILLDCNYMQTSAALVLNLDSTDLYMTRNHVLSCGTRYNGLLDYPQYRINKTTKHYKVLNIELLNKFSENVLSKSQL